MVAVAVVSGISGSLWAISAIDTVLRAHPLGGQAQAVIVDLDAGKVYLKDLADIPLQRRR